MIGSILRNRDGASGRCQDDNGDNCVSHTHSPWGLAMRGAGEVTMRSVGNIADASSVRKRRITDLSRERLESHFLRDERSILG